jgi:UTP:GlnB (protein PII) uridylyltransferase
LRVTGRDQLGLLSAVTHAVSSAGVVIHHAAVRTTAGVVDDDFEVSRPDNSKIDTQELGIIREQIARAVTRAV